MKSELLLTAYKKKYRLVDYGARKAEEFKADDKFLFTELLIHG